MVADTKKPAETSISNMTDKIKNAVTKAADKEKQGLAVTKVHSPCRPAQKRINREDISLGSVPQPAMEVAKKGKEMEGEVANITIDNEGELALLNLAMKEAEAMDEDRELETPTLAQGGDHLLQTVQAILEGIHQDVPIMNLTNQGKMDITLPSKDDEMDCTQE